MTRVKAELQKSFLEKDKLKNDKALTYGAIQGMVASLGDPYTFFLPPTDNKSSKDDLAGEFGGVGISLGYKDKTLAVMTTLTNTPAERAGIKAGDLILKITDKANNVNKDTSGIALADAVSIIRGKIGTDVVLKMYREGRADSFDVTLKRDTIVVPSIVYTAKTYQGKSIAWVQLNKFSEQLYKDWPDTVTKIKSMQAGGNFGGVVLDLRNNPGGFLDSAVMVASDFLDSGVVVKQESGDKSVITYSVDATRRQLLTAPVVVLLNGGSASASEILAGALHDHNRAKLIGEKSFGKGTVQQPEDLPDGSGLHVTIARWLLPSGKNIHGVGVEPDVPITWGVDPTKEDQYTKVYETLLGK
jgi:carboxyl-terminal processing protease